MLLLAQLGNSSGGGLYPRFWRRRARHSPGFSSPGRAAAAAATSTAVLAAALPIAELLAFLGAFRGCYYRGKAKMCLLKLISAFHYLPSVSYERFHT